MRGRRRRHARPHIPRHAIPPTWCAHSARSSGSASPSRSRSAWPPVAEVAAEAARTSPRASPPRTCSSRAPMPSRGRVVPHRPRGDRGHLPHRPGVRARRAAERPPRAVRRGAGRAPRQGLHRHQPAGRGLPLQVNLTRVGDEVFLGALGQDFRIALPPEQVALLDFGALYPTVVDWTTDPAEAGREDIEGTETVKVTGDLDAQKALTDLGPAPGADEVRPPPTPERPCAPGPWRPGSAPRTSCRGASTWCSAPTAPASADGRPRRHRSDGEPVRVWGQPVDITAPENARDLDLNELGSLVGG